MERPGAAVTDRLFRYRALTRDGSPAAGFVPAPSAQAAVAQLSRQELFVVRMADVGAASARRRAVSPGDLATGLRVLCEFLDAGLPMPRALAAFGPLAPASWRPGLESLSQGIRQGRGFAQALGESGLSVPPLVLGILEAGESGPGLAPALRRSAELMERSASLRAAIQSALVYPALLLVTGVAAMGLLIGVVLPRFAEILADLGQPLPVSTRMVLAAGALLARLAVPGILAGVLLVVSWRSWVATPEGRLRWHQLLLRTPIVGTVRLLGSTGRAAHALSALLLSGVALPRSLALAARATGDAEIGRRLEAARGDVLTGASLAAAMSEHRALSRSAIDLLRAGEQAGRVPEMLSHAGALEQERAERALRAAVRLLEPVLVLGLASAVALVAASLLQAVYGIRPA